MVGFKKVDVKIAITVLHWMVFNEYLDMRLKRATLKQELRELPAKKRRELLQALRDELTQFVRGGRFLFEWKVIFVRAKKT